MACSELLGTARSRYYGETCTTRPYAKAKIACFAFRSDFSFIFDYSELFFVVLVMPPAESLPTRPLKPYDPFWSHISEITYLKNNFWETKKNPKIVKDNNVAHVLKPWDHQKSNNHQIFIQFHNEDANFHEF